MGSSRRSLQGWLQAPDLLPHLGNAQTHTGEWWPQAEPVISLTAPEIPRMAVTQHSLTRADRYFSEVVRVNIINALCAPTVTGC